MGGTKRKIEIKKIESKASRDVTFSKRRKGLYSKASELCLLSGAKIAILATPVSSESNASFYSFGHSSVDSVVSAFLANQPPREEKEDKIMAHGKGLGLGLGFWWEDESLAQSNDPDKLRDAIESISKTLNNLKQLRSESVENHQRDSKKLKKKESLEMNLEIDDNVSNPEKLCPDWDGEEELDLDNLTDFETNSENLWMDLEMDDDLLSTQNMCSASEDGSAMVRDYLDLDNLQFSDCFNDLACFTAL